MLKNITFQIFGIIIILIITFVVLGMLRPATTFDPKNSTFTLNGGEINLKNGTSQIQIPEAGVDTIKYFGNEAYGDLNGDGVDDIAFLITEDAGGSGTFYYAVAAIKNGKEYKTTNAFFIGDRIAPQSSYIPKGSRELQINFAERRPGEPMSTPPSQGAVLLLKVTNDGVLEGLMK